MVVSTTLSGNQSNVKTDIPVSAKVMHIDKLRYTQVIALVCVSTL